MFQPDQSDKKRIGLEFRTGPFKETSLFNQKKRKQF